MTRDHIRKNMCIMFPECAPDRTQKILRRLRDDNAKDHHCAGSLTHVGRCAVDHAAADLIESLMAELKQVTHERDAYFESMKGLCATCKKARFCILPPGQCSCGSWQWRGVKEESHEQL